MRLVMVLISDRSGNDTKCASRIVDERERALLLICFYILMAQAVCGCEVFFSLYMNIELKMHGRYGKPRTASQKEEVKDYTYLLVLFVKKVDNADVVPESHDMCLWELRHWRHIGC